MPCTSPIPMVGKVGLFHVACKQCLNCRIKRQSALTLRALMEFQTSLGGEFVTLTYAEAPDRIDYSDFQSFLKRYRTWNHRNGNRLPIRFLGVGEYGGKTGRPHFHALLFNGLPFNQEDWRTRLWPHGFVYIGQVTPASIRYTARYTLKFEQKGLEAVAHWSRKPALGSAGIRELARYMRENNYPKPENINVLRIEGKTYPLDDTMQSHFWDEFTCGKVTSSRSETRAVARHTFMRRYGPEPELEAARQEERNRLYETARFLNETF